MRQAGGGIAASSVEREARKVANEKAKKWRAKIVESLKDATAATKGVVKGISGPPVFSAEEMRQDWAQYWRPQRGEETARQRAESWREQAVRSGLQQQEERVWHDITWKQWQKALEDTKGTGGLDRWSREECAVAPARPVDFGGGVRTPQ